MFKGLISQELCSCVHQGPQKQGNNFIQFAPFLVSLMKDSLYVLGVAFCWMVFLGISRAWRLPGRQAR